MSPLLLNLIILSIGFVLLIKGADFLVNNSSSLAKKMGISPMTIGITIVAFGTSLPEFLISFLATMSDSPDINVGNVIGSNICNIALVLGMTALITPIPVKFKVLLKELPMVVMITAIFSILIMDQVIDSADSIILLIIFSIFLYFSLGSVVDLNEEEIFNKSEGNFKILMFLLIGFIGVIGGAHLVVKAAVSIAESYKISQAVIGATVVAFGTSLPELITSLVAAMKGEMDISLGNVLGSNIFNIALIPGIIALIKPISVNVSVIRFDMWVMLFITIVLYPLIIARLRISRTEGIFLLFCYFTYNFILFKTYIF